MAVTIKDIAKEANVSIATVSRYINQNGYVGIESALKVKEAIKKLGYKTKNTVNTTSKLNLIEVDFPKINNPFYSELFEYLAFYLQDKGYDSILHLDHYQSQDINYYLERFKRKEIAGLITSSPIKIPKKGLKIKFPIVSFDRKISPQIPTVQSNNYDAGMQIAQSVLKQKKNRIIIAGAKEDYYPISDRIKGMIRVFNTFNAKFDLRSLSASDSIIAKKIAILQFLKNKNYDAICCTDDITALLAKECADYLKKDTLITGFDGTHLIQNLFPNLISARQHTKEIAELMSDLLLRQINDPSASLESVYTLPVSLINQN
ncbi:LacI family DNA-binding transcriptional regulator [Lactobacillus crispatus]|uniref:LacI family DNA-binding transcriptional regulator n=1 Tax=Lactobacillus crispatus TaxID=47770 RepID=UPI0014767A9C|nr:LacI family DNA-binding transcriptional regulator [Lactobacillus crispatus]MBE5058144.1 LacI family DNA-binding transcriptional regulator [Lactobacillus crispatus]NME25822.1 LacI family transcriptional regulator [Lactobacillus crispatus]